MIQKNWRQLDVTAVQVGFVLGAVVVGLLCVVFAVVWA